MDAPQCTVGVRGSVIRIRRPSRSNGLCSDHTTDRRDEVAWALRSSDNSQTLEQRACHVESDAYVFAIYSCVSWVPPLSRSFARAALIVIRGVSDRSDRACLSNGSKSLCQHANCAEAIFASYYFFSRSAARPAQRGSMIGVHVHSLRFRSTPHCAQRPAQSVEHNEYGSISRIRN